MGASTSRKTVKPRRTPKQATVKQIGDSALAWAVFYTKPDPQLAEKFREISRLAEKLLARVRSVKRKR